MTNELLADSYAFIEIILQNPNYQKYKHARLRTTKNAVAELTYWYIRTGKHQHTKTLARLYQECVGTKFSTIVEAMKFKYKHKKDKLSYTDCIGYATAAELQIPFLTGDEKFEGLPNVEFVQ